MSEYRIYSADDVGRMALVGRFVANDDEEAINLAREMAKGARTCEIWHENRLVATLGAKDLSA